ncbi:hypothetical protein SDC9_184962 [bioreactor metagenome]|uniref:Uncharacterized protein n=1 Tax=bioreactor metagenome TaxID=1076179 RepID=A0A645HMW1_9ZZZZ
MKQAVSLLLGEHCSRFIQHQQFDALGHRGRFLAQFPGDFGELLVSNRHLGDHHLRIKRNIEPSDGTLGNLFHLASVKNVHSLPEHFGEPRILQRFPIKQDVLGSSEIGQQGKLLVHHTDTCSQSINGG